MLPKTNASTLAGVGVGFRPEHFIEISQKPSGVDWLEILADNYLSLKGKTFSDLCQLREYYPLAQHSVGLSLGSSDPLNIPYLKKLKTLSHAIEPALISDHLAWVSTGGEYLHDLMPLPYTQDVMNHVVDRILKVQEVLGQRILIENISSYLTYHMSEMTEWEFLNTIAEKADCFILLDINNIYVNAYNHDFDPVQYIQSVNAQRVKQYHLGGHLDQQTHLLDTHSRPVTKPVWVLYEVALENLGHHPTLIEWDYDIPEFSVLLDEVSIAREKYQVIA